MFVMICALVCLTGCGLTGTRVVYVPSGEPVRLRKTIKGAAILAADKNGVEVPGVMDLPEGWYCLPDPGAKKGGGK